MPNLTPDEIRERRKNAAAHLAAGSLMTGGAIAAQQHVKDRTGIKSGLSLARDIKRTGGLRAPHGKYAAGWLATRGVAAAGVPLAAAGASNLLARKPKTKEALDLKRDVIGSAVDRTAVVLPKVNREKGPKRTAKQRLTAEGPIAAGGILGGMAGAKMAAGKTHKPEVAPKKVKGSISTLKREAKIVRRSKGRLMAIGAGTALGTAIGGAASVPFTRHATDVASSGTHRYSPSRGIYRREVAKADVSAGPVILPKAEQKVQVKRKHKAANLSLASAGLGVTALGLRSPALVKYGAGKSKRIAKLPGVQKIVAAEKKTTPASWNVGVIGTGVGATGALNSYRMQSVENRALDRQIKKAHNEDLSKALVPSGTFRVRPPKFAGVKTGGLRRVQTPLGLKTIRVRGSVG